MPGRGSEGVLLIGFCVGKIEELSCIERLDLVYRC